MEDRKRQYLTPFAELVDRMTVDQIKELLLSDGKESYAKEMTILSNDIDLIIEEKGLEMSSRLIRIVIALSQLNLHIWYNKDRMQEEPDRYDELLKLAHQLNGVRNRMKNLLLEEVGEKEKAAERSNFDTDGLEGWDVSI